MKNKRVLIIDDDADIRFMLNYFLAEKGFQIELASDGKEALELLASSSSAPDYILMDWIMPVMNGRMFFNYLLEINPSAFSKTKFIVLSGADISPDFPQIGKSIDLLMKPFSIDQLFQHFNFPAEIFLPSEL